MAEQQNPLIDEIQRLIAEMVSLRWSLQPEPWLHRERSMAQVKTLVALRQRRSARVGMVADWLGLSPNATTALLDHLQGAGLVCRQPDPSDRRAVIVRLSEDGEAAVADFIRANTREFATDLARLSAEELEALRVGATALMRTIHERVAERQPPPATPRNDGLGCRSRGSPLSATRRS